MAMAELDHPSSRCSRSDSSRCPRSMIPLHIFEDRYKLMISGLPGVRRRVRDRLDGR